MSGEETRDRVILHCDCNSFFASVETAVNPAFADVPMAVCGSSEDRHGIVLAKNDRAKKFGIVTAETVASAKRKCPGLVIAEPHHRLYMEYSRRVGSIYADYTDLIEPFGIDESWLDVTAGRLIGSGYEIAEQIRRRVKEEIGITVSIGVSFNKVFAKFGSDYKKPDAVTVISRENYREIVWPAPVGSLLFVGKKTEAALIGMGIRTVGDLAHASRELLTDRFGVAGAALAEYANGEEHSPVSPEREDAKSVSNGFTFRRDLTSTEDAEIAIDYLCEEIGMRLRRYGLVASGVALTVKDQKLQSSSKQKTLASPTDLASDLAAEAKRILRAFFRTGKPIRMITVAAQNLARADAASEQISLFEEKEETTAKKKNNEIIVEKIRQKYGSAAILKASVLGSDFGIYENRKPGPGKK